MATSWWEEQLREGEVADAQNMQLNIALACRAHKKENKKGAYYQSCQLGMDLVGALEFARTLKSIDAVWEEAMKEPPTTLAQSTCLKALPYWLHAYISAVVNESGKAITKSIEKQVDAIYERKLMLGSVSSLKCIMPYACIIHLFDEDFDLFNASFQLGCNLFGQMGFREATWDLAEDASSQRLAAHNATRASEGRLYWEKALMYAKYMPEPLLVVKDIVPIIEMSKAFPSSNEVVNDDRAPAGELLMKVQTIKKEQLGSLSIVENLAQNFFDGEPVRKLYTVEGDLSGNRASLSQRCKTPARELHELAIDGCKIKQAYTPSPTSMAEEEDAAETLDTILHRSTTKVVKACVIREEEFIDDDEVVVFDPILRHVPVKVRNESIVMVAEQKCEEEVEEGSEDEDDEGGVVLRL